ncbi:ATP-binding protein [Herbaspirillum sp. YR522]|uniref:ATP-binding protein n=1 Tax=Herbaspirillum sp. YR522 TaxID=1144342 RepID=UPI00026FCD90|nr:ATP-binding protein [Herbaspirillum sp. YR522]EJM99802.1 bacteriophytochrome (light-regulated signal transduction histidine kinase) [Herbaspirillum sp. YR522]
MTQHTDQTALLSNCDREPIHLPGSVQPHGALLVLRAVDRVILHVSENFAAPSGQRAADLVGQPLGQAFTPAAAAWLEARLSDAAIDFRPSYLGILDQAGQRHEVLAHTSGPALIVELESVPPDASTQVNFFYPLVTKFVGALAEARTVDEMSLLAINEIKALTGFGRVLLYRFDAEQNGEVIAETASAGYPSYLHQHFPASDIPQQARALYVANRVRLISDANYRPVPIVPQLDAITRQPVDLSFAVLRSVSPVHIEYMKNMGTLASMSISIIIRGQLWGLVSCHNFEPLRVRFETRAICEQLGQILAVHFEAAEEREEFNHRLELRHTLVRLLASLSKPDHFAVNLATVSHDLLEFVDASGAALVLGGEISLFGVTPSSQQIEDLVQWIARNRAGDVYETDSLASQYPGAADYAEVASGVLALSISQLHDHFLIWFRPEIVQTINWAGNPHLKATAADPSRLSPRRSFAVWSETVKGISKSWRQSEIDTALEFRTALLGIVLRRAEEMAELADNLGRVNKELESFSYSVSHDLRSPLRHIVGFADMLIEMEQERLSAKGVRFLNNIKSSAQFAGKLVDDLLSFSQMGRASLHISKVNMNVLVSAAIERLTQDIGERQVRWNVARFPEVDGDARFLALAVQNLLSNAVKYTRSQAQAVIDVDFEDHGDHITFIFKDNGVGFDAAYSHKLFGVFQRLHRMEEFEGTGIGLANVKRIIERHSGTVSAQGQTGQGAVFSFSLPKVLPLEARH